jgi:putative ABC transport system permease protein
MRNTSLKLAFKVMARRKVFTAISLVGISLTLVVLVVAAAIFDNTFGASAPESRIGRMRVVRYVSMFGPQSTYGSNPGFGFLQRTIRNLPGAEMVSVYGESMTSIIYDQGRRIEAQLTKTDGAYWRILDFHFVEGGPFTAADDDGDRHVVVLSQTLRDKVFGGGPAVGRTLNIGGSMFRVVGVVAPVAATRITAWSEMWAPIGALSAEERAAFGGHFNGLVLARRDADVKAMRREFNARVAREPISDPKEYKEIRAGLDTQFEAFARQLTSNRTSNPALFVAGILAVAALLFMSLPALNLITLNLSRIMERSGEIGVRKAFGAPRRALVTQFVAENIVLTLIGGVISIVLSLIALRVIESVAPIADVHLTLNLRVFAYGIAIAFLFGVLSGVYPAWKMSRLHPVEALRGGSL